MPNPSSKYLTSLPIFTADTPPTGPRTVVCFGTARGGTSMVAGAILGLGVPMGDGIQRNMEDPKFNLDRHGGPVGKFAKEARPVIAARNEVHAIWGWKFPFAQRYLDHLIEDLRAPYLVCVYRDPVPSVLRSKREADEAANFVTSRLRAQVRNTAMIDNLRVPSLMVSYEKAAAHPTVFLEELSGFLNLPIPDHANDIIDFMTPGRYKDPDRLIAHLNPEA